MREAKAKKKSESTHAHVDKIIHIAEKRRKRRRGEGSEKKEKKYIKENEFEDLFRISNIQLQIQRKEIKKIIKKFECIYIDRKQIESQRIRKQEKITPRPENMYRSSKKNTKKRNRKK